MMTRNTFLPVLPLGEIFTLGTSLYARSLFHCCLFSDERETLADTNTKQEELALFAEEALQRDLAIRRSG